LTKLPNENTNIERAANFTQSVNYMHKLKVGTLIRPWWIVLGALSGYTGNLGHPEEAI